MTEEKNTWVITSVAIMAIIAIAAIAIVGVSTTGAFIGGRHPVSPWTTEDNGGISTESKRTFQPIFTTEDNGGISTESKRTFQPASIELSNGLVFYPVMEIPFKDYATATDVKQKIVENTDYNCYVLQGAWNYLVCGHVYNGSSSIETEGGRHPVSPWTE